MATSEELRFYAKYPFTVEAKEYIKLSGIDFSKLDDAIIERSAQTVRSMLEKKYSPESQLSEIKKSGEQFLMDTLVTYPVSNIIAALTNDRMILREYALAQARRAYHLLQSEGDETVERIARQFFKLEKKDKLYEIPFYDYANNVPDGAENALVNQQLDHGNVLISRQQLCLLISQYVFRHVMMTQPDKRKVPKMFMFFADELKKAKGMGDISADLGEVDFSGFPPCMKRIYYDLQSGDKVGHQPRFVFSTFLGSINMPLDEAVLLFKEQPNFNEKKTRYYLEHSYGTKGGVKYSVPACSKMESYGICYRDATCRWRHPLSYYKRRKSDKAQPVRRKKQ